MPSTADNIHMFLLFLASFSHRLSFFIKLLDGIFERTQQQPYPMPVKPLQVQESRAAPTPAAFQNPIPISLSQQYSSSQLPAFQ